MKRWLRSEAIQTVLPYTGLALGFVFWATYTGPYKWLAEAQLQQWGKYYPSWTLVAVCLLLTGAVALLPKPAPRPADPENPIDVAERQQREAEAERSGATQRKVPGFIIGIGWFGLLALVLGAVSIVRVWWAGDLTRISIAELEDGAAIESGWVEVSGGRLLVDDAVAMTEGDENSIKDLYVPLVSEQWARGKPVYMYAYVWGERRLGEVAAEQSLRGMIAVTGLPGPVRTHFDASELAPAKGFHVLDTSENPKARGAAGRFFLIAAAVLAGLFSLLYAVWRVWPARRESASYW